MDELDRVWWWSDTPRRDRRMTAHSRALWTPLRHRDFRYLVTAQAISQTGDWLYNVALIVFVYNRTGSGAWVAAAGIVRLLPYTLFGALGGMVADWWPRKRVMIVSDVTRALAMLGLALVAASGGSAAVAIGLAGLATTLAVAYSPCVNAAMPVLVGEKISPVHTLVTASPTWLRPLGRSGRHLLLLGSPAAAFAGPTGLRSWRRLQ